MSILYNISEGKKKILQIINACMSHQMRNPINSIMATNLKLKQEGSTLDQLFREILLSEAQAARIKESIASIVDVASKQESQTKILNFYVSDLLCMAEIDRKTFKK